MATELNQTAEVASKFQLKEEVVKRYKLVFDEYDKEQEGLVQVKDLPAMFKTLRGAISEAESKSGLSKSTKSWAPRWSRPRIRLRATSSGSKTS